ncbi:MAG: DUF296 domain-containing protein [Bdellovibrionales bacterium]|nr:DUF296 domain-containing protein [Bdellovibrionales bacterium]
MRHRQTERGYIVRLERGEPLMETLRHFIHANEIQSATLTGLGAVCNSRLGFYDLETRSYVEKSVPEDCELVSLVGNISYFEATPVIHVHATLGTRDFQALAGHLFDTECSVTVELHIDVYQNRIDRKPDDNTGLNLMDL